MASQVHSQCGSCPTASLQPVLNTANSTWFPPASHLLSAECFLCLFFVDIGRRHFPKVKNSSWAQTSLLLYFQLSVLHYTLLQKGKYKFLHLLAGFYESGVHLEGQISLLPSHNKELPVGAISVRSHLPGKLVSCLQRSSQTSVQHCPTRPLK